MRPILAFFATATAAPAFAHTGAHLHPHGGGSWLAVVAGLAVLALAAALWGRR